MQGDPTVLSRADSYGEHVSHSPSSDSDFAGGADGVEHSSGDSEASSADRDSEDDTHADGSDGTPSSGGSDDTGSSRSHRLPGGTAADEASSPAASPVRLRALEAAHVTPPPTGELASDRVVGELQLDEAMANPTPRGAQADGDRGRSGGGGGGGAARSPTGQQRQLDYELSHMRGTSRGSREFGHRILYNVYEHRPEWKPDVREIDTRSDWEVVDEDGAATPLAGDETAEEGAAAAAAVALVRGAFAPSTTEDGASARLRSSHLGRVQNKGRADGSPAAGTGGYCGCIRQPVRRATAAVVGCAVGSRPARRSLAACRYMGFRVLRPCQREKPRPVTALERRWASMSEWHLSLSPDRSMIAVVQDNAVEFRRSRENFTGADSANLCRIPFVAHNDADVDSLPVQARQTCWSADSSLFALSDGNRGVVLVLHPAGAGGRGAVVLRLDDDAWGDEGAGPPTGGVAALSFRIASVGGSSSSVSVRRYHELLVLGFDGALRRFRVCGVADRRRLGDTHIDASRANAELGARVDALAVAPRYLSHVSCMDHSLESNLVVVGGGAHRASGAELAAGRGCSVTVWKVLDRDPWYELVCVSSPPELAPQRPLPPDHDLLTGESESGDDGYAAASDGGDAPDLRRRGRTKGEPTSHPATGNQRRPDGLGEAQRFRTDVTIVDYINPVRSLGWCASVARGMRRAAGSVPAAQAQTVTQLLFSPTRRAFATLDAGGNVHVWGSASGTTVFAVTGEVVHVGWWSPTQLLLVLKNGQAVIRPVLLPEGLAPDEALAANLLGPAPEVFSQPLAVAASGDGENAFLLESVRQTVRRRRLWSTVADDEAEGDDILNHALLQRRKFRLVSLRRTSPQELFNVQVEIEQYDKAIAIAEEYALDTDPLFQARWLREPATVRTVDELLGRVSDTEWVLQQCVSRVPEDLQTAEHLLQFGLRKSVSGAGNPSIEGTRRRLLQYQDRLQTLAMINSAEEVIEYDAEQYSAFREIDLVAASLAFAKQSRLMAVFGLLSRHPASTMPSRLCILGAIPETTSPAEYAAVLPTVPPRSTPAPPVTDDVLHAAEACPHLFFWLPSTSTQPEAVDVRMTVRPADWCEPDTPGRAPESDLDFSGDAAEEAVAALSTPSGVAAAASERGIEWIAAAQRNPAVLATWYRRRALELDNRAGQLACAVTLCRLGLRRVSTQEDAQASAACPEVAALEKLEAKGTQLLRLISSCDMNPLTTLSLWESLSAAERLDVMLEGATAETICPMIRQRVRPLTASSPRAVEGEVDWSRLLHDYLVSLVSRDTDGTGFRIVVAVVEESKPTLPAKDRLVRGILDTVQLILDAAYASTLTSRDHWDDVHAMIACTPAHVPEIEERLPGLAAAIDQIERLQCLLIACEVLARYEMAPQLSFLSVVSLADAEDSTPELNIEDSNLEGSVEGDVARSLILRLCRDGIAYLREHSSADDETCWLTILDDAVQLRDEVFVTVPPVFVYRAYLNSLLLDGQIDLAARVLAAEPPRIPEDVAEGVILSVAREHFNSAPSVEHRSMRLAKECLSILRPDSPDVAAEQRMVDAVALVARLGVPIVPLQVRTMMPRMRVIDHVLKENPFAYKGDVAVAAALLREHSGNGDLATADLLAFGGDTATEAPSSSEAEIMSARCGIDYRLIMQPAPLPLPTTSAEAAAENRRFSFRSTIKSGLRAMFPVSSQLFMSSVPEAAEDEFDDDDMAGDAGEATWIAEYEESRARYAEFSHAWEERTLLRRNMRLVLPGRSLSYDAEHSRDLRRRLGGADPPGTAMLKLAELLGLTHELESVAVRVRVARAAMNAGDNSAALYCMEQLRQQSSQEVRWSSRRGKASAVDGPDAPNPWPEVCALALELATSGALADLRTRHELCAFALVHCSPDELQGVLADWQELDARCTCHTAVAVLTEVATEELPGIGSHGRHDWQPTGESDGRLRALQLSDATVADMPELPVAIEEVGELIAAVSSTSIAAPLKQMSALDGSAPLLHPFYEDQVGAEVDGDTDDEDPRAWMADGVVGADVLSFARDEGPRAVRDALLRAIAVVESRDCVPSGERIARALLPDIAVKDTLLARSAAASLCYDLFLALGALCSMREPETAATVLDDLLAAVSSREFRQMNGKADSSMMSRGAFSALMVVLGTGAHYFGLEVISRAGSCTGSAYTLTMSQLAVQVTAALKARKHDAALSSLSAHWRNFHGAFTLAQQAERLAAVCAERGARFVDAEDEAAPTPFDTVAFVVDSAYRKRIVRWLAAHGDSELLAASRRLGRGVHGRDASGGARAGAGAAVATPASAERAGAAATARTSADRTESAAVVPASAAAAATPVSAALAEAVASPAASPAASPDSIAHAVSQKAPHKDISDAAVAPPPTAGTVRSSDEEKPVSDAADIAEAVDTRGNVGEAGTTPSSGMTGADLVAEPSGESESSTIAVDASGVVARQRAEALLELRRRGSEAKQLVQAKTEAVNEARRKARRELSKSARAARESLAGGSRGFDVVPKEDGSVTHEHSAAMELQRREAAAYLLQRAKEAQAQFSSLESVADAEPVQRVAEGAMDGQGSEDSDSGTAKEETEDQSSPESEADVPVELGAISPEAENLEKERTDDVVARRQQAQADLLRMAQEARAAVAALPVASDARSSDGDEDDAGDDEDDTLSEFSLVLEHVAAALSGSDDATVGAEEATGDDEVVSALLERIERDGLKGVLLQHPTKFASCLCDRVWPAISGSSVPRLVAVCRLLLECWGNVEAPVEHVEQVRGILDRLLLLNDAVRGIDFKLLMGFADDAALPVDGFPAPTDAAVAEATLAELVRVSHPGNIAFVCDIAPSFHDVSSAAVADAFAFVIMNEGMSVPAVPAALSETLPRMSSNGLCRISRLVLTAGYSAEGRWGRALDDDPHGVRLDHASQERLLYDIVDALGERTDSEAAGALAAARHALSLTRCARALGAAGLPSWHEELVSTLPTETSAASLLQRLCAAGGPVAELFSVTEALGEADVDQVVCSTVEACLSVISDATDDLQGPAVRETAEAPALEDVDEFCGSSWPPTDGSEAIAALSRILAVLAAGKLGAGSIPDEITPTAELALSLWDAAAEQLRQFCRSQLASSGTVSVAGGCVCQLLVTWSIADLEEVELLEQYRTQRILHSVWRSSVSIGTRDASAREALLDELLAAGTDGSQIRGILALLSLWEATRALKVSIEGLPELLAERLAGRQTLDAYANARRVLSRCGMDAALEEMPPPQLPASDGAASPYAASWSRALVRAVEVAAATEDDETALLSIVVGLHRGVARCGLQAAGERCLYDALLMQATEGRVRTRRAAIVMGLTADSEELRATAAADIKDWDPIRDRDAPAAGDGAFVLPTALPDDDLVEWVLSAACVGFTSAATTGGCRWLDVEARQAIFAACGVELLTKAHLWPHIVQAALQNAALPPPHAPAVAFSESAVYVVAALVASRQHSAGALVAAEAAGVAEELRTIDAGLKCAKSLLSAAEALVVAPGKRGWEYCPVLCHAALGLLEMDVFLPAPPVYVDLLDDAPQLPPAAPRRAVSAVDAAGDEGRDAAAPGAGGAGSAEGGATGSLLSFFG